MKYGTTNHYAIRFRNNDGIHKKGDIQFFGREVTYIGQTPECGLKLPPHPRFADSCYAVIRSDAVSGNRYIIRQEQKADILINGTGLGIAAQLNENDLITFGNTTMLYTVEEGEQPQVTYIKHKSQKALWIVISLIIAALAGIMLKPEEEEKNIFDIYANEVPCIYKIEADTLVVLKEAKDTLDVIPLPKAEVGTGFITQCGHFVTARHCVEFWLGYESGLVTDINEIESPFVRWAIEAEADPTIHLVAKLKISDGKGKKYAYTSDDFAMDKSRDNIYECGNFSNEYLWRSIVSRYEDRDAELGDAAIMKWEHGKGNIILAQPGILLKLQENADMQSFGYPQHLSKQQAVLTADNGKLRSRPTDTDEIFYCKEEFDKGFSGAPVFVTDKEKNANIVIGIVSRLEGKRTIIVPVSQIHNLIKEIKKDGK